jgi:DnaJ family protein B protein 12
MDSANRDEALRCFELAKDCSDRSRAIRLLQKSLKLCPTDECEEFLQRLLDDKNRSTNSDGQGKRREEPAPPGPRPGSGPRARDYTDEQLAVVQRTNRRKDYYEILEVTKDASDSDLKKQYRKLALQLHPDKNKAPGASDAFKAVGTAFAVLSDKEKRRQYDLYGPNGPQVENTHFYGNNHFHYRGQQGYYDFDPNEIFNAFFGGRYGYAGDVYFPHQNHHHHHHDYGDGPETVWLRYLIITPL